VVFCVFNVFSGSSMAELGMGLSGADLIISQSSSLRIIPILIWIF
jgi:hypothetical protein